MAGIFFAAPITNECRKRLPRKEISVNDSTDPFTALDRSIVETAKRAQQETKIYRRVRALMRENGLTYGYSEEQALDQATSEVMGVLAR